MKQQELDQRLAWAFDMLDPFGYEVGWDVIQYENNQKIGKSNYMGFIVRPLKLGPVKLEIWYND